jgi:hypothetical protein
LTCVSAATNLGHYGLIMVLFETPSGFAIFYFDGVSLYEPDAMEVLALFFIPLLLLCVVPLVFVIGLIFMVSLCLLQNIWANFVTQYRANRVSSTFSPFFCCSKFVILHITHSTELASYMIAINHIFASWRGI